MRSFLKGSKIRRQMIFVYFVALVLPLGFLGLLLLNSAEETLYEHYEELLDADNTRIKSFLSELTSQTYSVSADVTSNSDIRSLLVTNYESVSDYVQDANSISSLDSLVYNNQYIASITIYTDNPTIANYKHFVIADEDITTSAWYRRAIYQKTAFWTSEEVVVSGVSKYYLELVRFIPLSDSDYHAVVVIRLSDNYIRSKISSNYVDAIFVDSSWIISSSQKRWYGQNLISVDTDSLFYSYLGTMEVDGEEYLASVSTTNLSNTTSKLYICVLNSDCYSEIASLMRLFYTIFALAIAIPVIILLAYTLRFTHRLSLLRQQMSRASAQEYENLKTIKGRDELAEASADLNKMVATILQKDADMYEAKLAEQELKNEQQRIEFQMLAGQINPHFLYNALETIRMKALTDGNTEVARAVQTLGKTLRHVLENTGTSFTTLAKELEHIANYVEIQKFRFGDRVNYQVKIAEDVDINTIEILPLLLQPIVENAVTHGLERLSREGEIITSLKITDGLLHLTVTDNGRGMSQDELDAIRQKLATPDLILQTSIGLYNINQRLHLCYGDDYGIEIESTLGEGTSVKITIPV